MRTNKWSRQWLLYTPQTLQNLCCECKGHRRVSRHCTSRSCLPLPQSYLGNVCSKCVCGQRFLSSQQSKACLGDHKVCIALHVADGAVAVPHFNVSRRRVHFKGHCIAMAMALVGFKKRSVTQHHTSSQAPMIHVSVFVAAITL